ncbi:hypothetical protein R1flu_013074 [Riccia fluitans]|uniref:RRM domain-containing protein n=1 Tax=Riccia fluitans TaxID=41844 RepID=A0ABD1ZFT8_9MARC
MGSPPGDNAASSSTFQLNVSSLGAIKLKDAVKAKLSEFMGSYTDDVLAEYVVVLVGHGKRQSQAIADLEAFLGDQSKEFVAWLWEHLALNQASYVDQSSPSSDKVIGKGSSPTNGNASREEQAYSKRGESGKVLASVIETVNTAAPTPVKDGKESNQGYLIRGVKGSEALTGSSKRPRSENHGLRKGNGEFFTDEEPLKDHPRPSDIKRTRSPEPWSRRGRDRVEDRQNTKRDSPPQVKAPRRLLESAVRDAVAPGGVINGGGSSRRTESGFKRLRSVVSADVDIPDTPVEPYGRHQQTKPRLELSRKGAKVSPAVAVALKAAAAAAEDVNNNLVKTKGGRIASSVWDRLGHRNSERTGLRSDEMVEPDRPDVDITEDRDAEWVGSKQGVAEEVHRGKRPNWRKLSERLGRGPIDAEEGGGLLSEMGPTAAKDHFKNKKQLETDWPASTIASQASFEDRIRNEEDIEGAATQEDRRVFRFQSSKAVIASTQHRHSFIHQDSPLPLSKTISGPLGDGSSSEKLSDTNTLNQELENVDAVPDLRDELLAKRFSAEKTGPPSSAAVETDDVLEMKKRMRQVQLEMTKLRAKQAEVTKEVQKVVSAPGTAPKAARSQEEINAHSVCVSNIHFAATKEAIMAHFSPCGEIVRVTILMDPATGKSKGSAYIEFALKEGVESAINMNDSSLLSRTLKVMRKDAADAVSPAAASRPPHGIPFVPVRGPPVGSFLRGIPPMMRRLPSLARPFTGSAHLQWKRETSAPSPGVNANSNAGQSTGSTPTTPAGRAAPLRSPSASVMGDRYGHGPIRMTRSLSYVRPAPYTPRQTAPAVQEQKVVN